MKNGYLGLKDLLRDKVISGEYPPGTRIPSRNQIMKDFKFARATVDRAVNELIAEDLLRAEKGGGTYVVDSITEKRNKKIIYVVLHRETTITQTTLYPFLNVFRNKIDKKYQVEFITIYEMAVNPERFLKTAKAVIFCLFDPRYLETALLLKKKKCPILLINRKERNFDYITTDSFSGIYDAISSLKKSTIGMVAENPAFDQPYCLERAAAFFKAVALKGLITDRAWLIYGDADNPEDGIDKLFKLFSSDKRPAILFCAGYLMPYVITALHANKIKLGQDIKIIHFDPLPETNNKKGIICLEQNFYKMGLKAMEWINLIDEEKTVSGKKSFQIEIAPKIHSW